MKKENLNAIQFIVLKEEWNKYQLEDGSILVSKFVLERLMHVEYTNSNKKGLLPHGSAKFSVCFTPEHCRVEPKENDDEINDKEKLFIDFDIIAEQSNKHEFQQKDKNYLLKLKTNVIKIEKIKNTYDKYGYPRYSLKHVLNLSVHEIK